MSGLIALGAAVAVITGIGAGLGIGMATSKAVDAIARQPEADSKITKALLLGCALAEATAIYGFVIGLLIILEIMSPKSSWAPQKRKAVHMLNINFWNIAFTIINIVVLYLFLNISL